MIGGDGRAKASGRRILSHSFRAPDCYRMNGWARSGDDKAVDKMQQLFDRAQQQYTKQGIVECKPNQFAYATLVHAYAKTKSVNGALKAEVLLGDMYEEYLEQQQSNSLSLSPNKADRVVPNTQLVTAVMDCWQKSGSLEAGKRAEALLQWMIGTGEKTKDDAIRPNARSFSTAISAWARTRAAGKAHRARQLLLKMEQMHQDGQVESPPNAYCYTNVLNSCAYCIQEDSEKKASLAIAVKTYKELLESNDPKVQPSHVTFSTFLTALRNLLPENEKRVNAVRTVFEAAVERGQVDSLVLQKLQAVLLPKDFGKILEQNGQGVPSQIPKSWSRNVR